MNTFFILVKRNCKIYFKDKVMFFTSLITPLALLVLYSTFLGNIYKSEVLAVVDAINKAVPESLTLSDKILNSFVGGQLLSSILAVSAINVAASCNMLMVQDKATGAEKDLMISPVSPALLMISYYVATLISTFAVCYTATAVGFVYLAIVGWYMSFADVILLLVDVFILVMLGTAVTSLINFFLKTMGQVSAINSTISSGYGFICGAYMPISNFGEWLGNAIGFFPGAYGTSLLRRHALRGVIREMEECGITGDSLNYIKDRVDYSLYVFGNEIPAPVMYAALIGSILLLVGIYVLLGVLKNKKIIMKK